MITIDALIAGLSHVKKLYGRKARNEKNISRYNQIKDDGIMNFPCGSMLGEQIQFKDKPK